MKKLQFSVFVVVFILLLFSISACGGENSSSEKEEEPADSTASDENGGEGSDEAKGEAAYDLGGRVIRIAQHWDMTPEGGTEIGDMTVERWKEVEEKYNITIEWIVVPWEEKVNQLTSTILAGEPFADIVGLDTTQAAALIQQDYLYALDDLVDLSTVKLPQAIQNIGTLNGKVYLFGHQVNQSGGMYYNKTMFEQAGLPDPYELQQAGEWTWDAMLDAAKTLTDGTTFGLSGDANLLAEYSLATNGGQILDMDTGEMTIDTPNAIEGYEFMSALYNEHRVVKPNEGNNWEDPRRYFTEGLVGMTQGWVWEAEGRVETPFEWGYVFWPKGPQAADYVTPISSVEGLAIPKGVEDPEIVYQIWEDMQVWEVAGDDVIEWFETVLPNVESVDTATRMLEKISSNYWSAFQIEEILWDMNENIATGAESPAQAVASVKGEAQARVDEFMGK
ncbi:ABC-type glycerol-3-phosphate transport system, substrate-binding protein [Evansella caseinilytica]|uniref:ABC-type glycerol-3-phosphate transport system, substrate-binding protein n=1 Tax=Evansella caseinilytica TaxID=1503961 RepID=A0A1H3P231_9BACI|nr:extracellular solute-binding protein [Evansella caseinilytica]SDY95162.1 ABC-type glycerol-3-phosphate transport system, substrate-binding protein [Evansella caseinilytica]